MNSVAGMLAPDAESGDGQSGAITAFTSENDPELVGDAFPVILKLTEMMMLENPEKLRKMVAGTQAHSTDLQSPESVKHLCAKCDKYAENWKPVAEKLWEERKAEKAAKQG